MFDVISGSTDKTADKANYDDSVEMQKIQAVVDALPVVCTLWLGYKLTYCNQAAANFFGLKDPREYIDNFAELSPNVQPCGTKSMEKAKHNLDTVYKTGHCKFEWMHQTLDGVPILTEVTLNRVKWQDEYGVVGHVLDIRDVKESSELLTKLIDALPMFMEVWDSQHNLISCNEYAERLLKAPKRNDFVYNNARYYPKHQPCGTDSKEKEMALQKKALSDGYVKFDFVVHAADGEEIPLEYIYVLIRLRKKAFIVGYGYDLRGIRQPVM